ncbi:hypothetical protein [Paraburkholderia sp. SIMBA_054]|uniref:hypothetical protein n=1 Tax=Paraburkholderia sp. SIMBA_054 TaxID=3085795 RepID=UPI00397BC150
MNAWGHASLLLDVLFFQNLLPECHVAVFPDDHPTDAGVCYIETENVKLGRTSEEVSTAIWKLVVCWRENGYLDLLD